MTDHERVRTLIADLATAERRTGFYTMGGKEAAKDAAALERVLKDAAALREAQERSQRFDVITRGLHKELEQAEAERDALRALLAEAEAAIRDLVDASDLSAHTYLDLSNRMIAALARKP